MGEWSLHGLAVEVIVNKFVAFSHGLTKPVAPPPPFPPLGGTVDAIKLVRALRSRPPPVPRQGVPGE